MANSKLISVEINKDDLDFFTKTIDNLINDIEREVSQPKDYRKLEEKIRADLHNNVFGFENTEGYKNLKEDLKQMGLIPEKEVLHVTGQLVNDYGWSLMNKHPNEISSGFGFAKIFRRRPTLPSMHKARRKQGELEYIETTSAGIARALENAQHLIKGSSAHQRKPYPITDKIYTRYGDEIANHVVKLVERAFNKHARRK